jgi:hypothetical protein
MCAAQQKYFAFPGKLLQVASVVISAQMMMPKKRLDEMRKMGLKPWDDAHMTEVVQMNTDGSAHTVEVQLWQVVFWPHDNCPPQCMGAQGFKCVILPADRDRWLRRGNPTGPLDYYHYEYNIKCIFDCEVKSKRTAILEMHGGDFMVCKTPTGSQYPFRLNPFMTGQEFFDMMVLQFGSDVRDWEFKMGDEHVMLKLSLLMSGIHFGLNEVDKPLTLRRPVADWPAS